MEGKIAVNIGEIALASCGVLFSPAVGSCIALVLQCGEAGRAAMAHIFLPHARAHAAPAPPGKYADTAIDEMERRLSPCAAAPLHAFLAGGARMFPAGFHTEITDIGAMNRDAVLAILRSHHIPVLFDDTGGTAARNVTFDIRAGAMTTQTAHALMHA